MTALESAAAPVALPLRVGTRTLARLRFNLVRHYVDVDRALGRAPPPLPDLPPPADGYFIRALPYDLVGEVSRAGLRSTVRQRYDRRYAALDQHFDAYLAGFSARSRSDLRRKRRRFEERSGGVLDVRLYRTPDEMVVFHREARTLSARTYQERLLNGGLPADALPGLRALAARDAVRGFLLFLDGRPVSYLHAPARGDALIYAHLGYDPAHGDLSPGTVLQLEAMRMLMEERRFRWFDFTEGDGQHKRLFATGSIPSCDLLLLRRTFGNLAAMRALDVFDGSVTAAKRALRAAGLGRIARAARR